MDEQPAKPQSLSKNLPRRVLGAVTSSTVLYLGLTVLIVVAGSLILAWFDKTMPEAVVALAGVALGYLGKVIDDQQSGNG